jgi:hypothetical protein
MRGLEAGEMRFQEMFEEPFPPIVTLMATSVAVFEQNTFLQLPGNVLRVGFVSEIGLRSRTFVRWRDRRRLNYSRRAT